MPNPVPVKGIPDEANSKDFPKCYGTIAHEDYWQEQFRRCLEGYETGGVIIPGRYYYYLNFCQIHTVGRGYHFPDYTDLDLEFFRLVEIAKQEHKGIICDKRRRVGRSHVMAAIFSYGIRFISGGYKAGVVSGLKDYAEGFYKKFKDDNSKKPPELHIHHLHDNMDEWQAGYVLQSTGIKGGSHNMIFCRTANTNENVFKGEALDDCGFEEAGEFKNITKCYGATRSCFYHGMTMIGTPYLWGTGGAMSSSAGFKDMLENAHDYNLIPFDIFGPRMLPPFYIGATNIKNDVEEVCPNIMEKYGHLSPEQILGCEDILAASEVILEKSSELKVAKNKQPYYDHLQTFPMNRREMFLNFSGNPFDPDALSQQAQEIAIQPYSKYKRYILKWETDKDGKPVSPRKVVRDIAPDHKEDWECVLMLEDAIAGYKDLDVAGIDSYDQDKSSTSKSLGGMCVIRRKDIKTNKNCRRPICIVRMRPRRKEEFYEACLMVAFYYNLKKNVLVDFEKAAVMRYFEENEGQKFLAERPRSFESKNSEQNHKYGMRFTTYSKPLSIGLLQSWVLDDIDECWFLIIIKELSDYNVGITGDDSDWDLADALMLALVRISDMGHRKQPRHEADEMGSRNIADLGNWQEVGGRMVDMNSKHGGSGGGGWSDAGIDKPQHNTDQFSLTDFK